MSEEIEDAVLVSDETEEVSLPYEVIDNLAGRPFIRNDERFSRADITAFSVKLKDISYRDGYNPRDVFDGIEELARSLIVDGQEEPIEIDVLKDGRNFLKEGHRRLQAWMWLVDKEEITLDYEVVFIPSKSDLSEFDRLKQSWISNSDHLKKPFGVLAKAEVARRFKYCFGSQKTDDEVAEIMHVSRQTVTNLITIAKAPDDVKQEIKKGMTTSDALSYIRRQNKNKRQAEKKEEESHLTSMNPTSDPVDLLKGDMEDLRKLEDEADDIKLARESRERQRMDKLLEVANEVPVIRDELMLHIGKRLAAPACREWKEDFVDEDTGETITVDRKEKLIDGNVLIDEETISKLLSEPGIGNVFIYKEVTAAESVITEPVAQKEKPQYDEMRPEIAQIQNAIKLCDRASVRVSKLEISDGDKKDLLDWMGWQMKDLIEAREWIHKNKKRNKKDM